MKFLLISLGVEVRETEWKKVTLTQQDQNNWRSTKSKRAPGWTLGRQLIPTAGEKVADTLQPWALPGRAAGKTLEGWEEEKEEEYKNEGKKKIIKKGYLKRIQR